jgi:hypothetical protein
MKKNDRARRELHLGSYCSLEFQYIFLDHIRKHATVKYVPADISMQLYCMFYRVCEHAAVKDVPSEYKHATVQHVPAE